MGEPSNDTRIAENVDIHGKLIVAQNELKIMKKQLIEKQIEVTPIALLGFMPICIVVFVCFLDYRIESCAIGSSARKQGGTGTMEKMAQRTDQQFSQSV